MKRKKKNHINYFTRIDFMEHYAMLNYLEFHIDIQYTYWRKSILFNKEKIILLFIHWPKKKSYQKYALFAFSGSGHWLLYQILTSKSINNGKLGVYISLVITTSWHSTKWLRAYHIQTMYFVFFFLYFVICVFGTKLQFFSGFIYSFNFAFFPFYT